MELNGRSQVRIEQGRSIVRDVSDRQARRISVSITGVLARPVFPTTISQQRWMARFGCLVRNTAALAMVQQVGRPKQRPRNKASSLTIARVAQKRPKSGLDKTEKPVGVHPGHARPVVGCDRARCDG
jgi:hypothetical protein